MSLENISSEDLLKRLREIEPKIKSLDVKQKTVKVIANSLYGILGNRYFSFYDPDLAEAITLTGQVVIKSVKMFVDNFLNRALKTSNINYCLYLDTDSSYITLERLVIKMGWHKLSQNEIVNHLEKFVFEVIQPAINKPLSELVCGKMGALESRMNFKLEGIGPNILFLAKKKYAFNILYNEGVRYEKPKMKVMGIEVVRSSTPSVVKDDLKRALSLALSSTEDELQKYIHEVRSSFLSLDYTDVSFPRGVNGLSTYKSTSGIYEKGCPIHVRASLLYNHYLKQRGLESKYPMIGEGDKIKFVALKMPNPIHENVIAFPSKLPEEFGLGSYIDMTTQYQKAFMAPLEKILAAVGWNAEKKVDLESFC